MAPIFDVLSTVNGHLNNIMKFYDGNGTKASIRSLENIPEFVMTSINRVLELSDIVINEDAEITINEVIIADTGDKFNPVYIAVTSNISEPAVDKVPLIITYKDQTGPGIGYVAIVPEIIFNQDTNIDVICSILNKLYFGLLNLDPNLDYSASPAIIRFSDSDKVRISSYDLAMSCVALCCTNINIRAWFGTNDYASYVLDVYSDEQLPMNKKEKLLSLMRKVTLIGGLRDSIATGSLLKTMFDEVE